MNDMTVWWRRNRSWARPVGCLAVALPLLSFASCLGTALTFAFGAAKLGVSIRDAKKPREGPDRPEA